MSVLWPYYWPALAAGLLLGVISGLLAVGRGRFRAIIALGLALSLAGAAIWHGPLGAANRVTVAVENATRRALDHYEMPQIDARLQRGPLSRQLILSGKADDFQRSELARLMSQVPGASRATWSRTDRSLPLIVESFIAAAVGYAFGLLLAYLITLHRRHNAQWSW